MSTLAVISVPSSGDNAIDSLLWGTSWESSTISYSFPELGSLFLTEYSSAQEPYTGFEALTVAQRLGVRQALAEWASVANVTFVEVAEPYSSGVIRLGQSSAPYTAWSYLPSSRETGGDIWFGYNYNYDNPHWQTYADYAYHIMIHELGHALGLKHPGQYSDSDVAPYAGTATDALQYSVMSYISYPGAGLNVYPGSASYPQTPMMNDIAAIQYIYGANFNHNSDDTVYSFSPSDTVIFRTIWDGNGVDTYDASAYSTGVSLQLAPGLWSTLESNQLADLGNGVKAPGSVANALLYAGDPRSLIENAVGGSGDDSLRGNVTDNQLTGGAGSDQIWGGSGGDDLLMDDSGANMFWWTSGEGNDAIVSSGKGSALLLYGFAFTERRYAFSPEGHFWLGQVNHADYVTVSNWVGAAAENRIQSFVFKEDGTYKAIAWNAGGNIEVLLDSAAYREVQVNDLECIDTSNARLGGTSGADRIKGGDGNDDIWGGMGGNDRLTGGLGSDTYWFTEDNGADTITVSDTNDQDSVRFSTSWQPADLRIWLTGNDLHMVAGSTETVLDAWACGGGYQLNRFLFEQTGQTYMVEITDSGSGQFVQIG